VHQNTHPPPRRLDPRAFGARPLPSHLQNPRYATVLRDDCIQTVVFTRYGTNVVTWVLFFYLYLGEILVNFRSWNFVSAICLSWTHASCNIFGLFSHCSQVTILVQICTPFCSSTCNCRNEWTYLSCNHVNILRLKRSKSAKYCKFIYTKYWLTWCAGNLTV